MTNERDHRAQARRHIPQGEERVSELVERLAERLLDLL